MAEFKYLEMTVTIQNCIHKEIKWRLHLGNAGYLSVKNTLSSFLLPKIKKKKLKIKMYKTLMLPVILCGCEISCLSP
jgi:hypothetical protein